MCPWHPRIDMFEARVSHCFSMFQDTKTKQQTLLYFYVCFLLPGIEAKRNRPVKRGIPPGIPWFICFTQARESIRVARATRELLKKFAAGYHTFHVPCKWTWDFEGISDFQSRAKMNRFCKTCTDLKLDIDCCWLLVLDHGTFLSMVGLSSSTNSVVEVEEHHDHIHSHLQIKEAAELFLGLPWLSIVFHVKCPTSRSDDEREWGIRWNSRDLIVLMSLVLVPWYFKRACRVEQLSALNFWFYNPSVW